MTKDSELLLKEYKNEYKNYKSFIDNNEWYYDVFPNKTSGKLQSLKLNTETSIIDTIISGTKKFKEDVGDDIDKKPIKDFIKFTSTIINEHINRVQRYKKLFPITNESTESDVEFHSDLFALITKTKVALSKLQIDEEAAKRSIDIFHSNQKAPLLMREFLCELIPEIREKTEALNIDFNAPFVNEPTAHKMFINIPESEIPKWDPNKHYFEQDEYTIRFWEEERRKITYGVNIDGYHISPWLYFHINHFKLAYIDSETGNKVITQPLFRDNEWYIEQNYLGAKKHGRCGMILYGSRRITKTVIMSSKELHALMTIPKCTATTQVFSVIPDLKAIIEYITTAYENTTDAFKIPANSMDIKSGIQLGLKGKKAQDRYDFATMSVINLESGNTKKGSQKTAASTPDFYLMEEIGKGDIIDSWKAGMPSFAGGKNGKWRTTPIGSGTAGDSELSQDAEKILKDPEQYNIYPMDWNLLNSMVPQEFRTWTEEPFATFVPAQFSLEAPPKIKTTFGEFIGKPDSEELSKIDFYVTDWKACKEFFEKEREIKSGDMNLLAGYVNSFPLAVEDCYLTTEINKFPGLECKARKSYIEKEGLTGEKYRLYKDSLGNIQSEMVPNEPVITDYPYKGGNFDAPIVMLENPLLQNEKPPLGLYVMGLDDIKQDTTKGDSVASATIFKRGYEGGEWANRIVAWYDSRPDKKRDYYRQLYLLMKIYNARVLYENEDNGFIEWVETHHPEDVYVHFSTGVGLASEENMHRNSSRKFGWSPTGQNIYLAEQKVVMYTKEDNIVVGDRSDLTGVDRINHPMLLEELYKYKKGQNADRLRSFSLALTLARYYDNSYQYMKARKKRREDEEYGYKKKKKSNRRSSQGIIYDSRIK